MLRLLIVLLVAPLLWACSSVPAAPTQAEKRIALTFDDVPRGAGAFLTHEERTRQLIAALKEARVEQAAFFVNPSFLEKPERKGGEERVAAYVAAGHVLANHSFSHHRLSLTPTDIFLDDIDKAEAWLAGREGRRPWFRFPYLNEGGTDTVKRDAVRAGLAARGLRNGYVTVSAADWNLEQLAVNARKAGKRIDMDALRDLYVESHVAAAEYFDDLARRTLGRSPAHVMLLHETDIAALYVDDLVAALRRAGWTIVTTDEAFADAISSAMPDVPSAQGTLTEALAREKGILPARSESGERVARTTALFAERVLKEQPAQ